MVLGYRHPMGPLRLTDLVGLDVRLGISEYLASTLGERFPLKPFEEVSCIDPNTVPFPLNFKTFDENTPEDTEIDNIASSYRTTATSYFHLCLQNDW